MNNEEKERRIQHLNKLLSLLNDKLNMFEEQLKSAMGPLSFELQYRIENEIKPSIKKYEDERDSLMK